VRQPEGTLTDAGPLFALADPHGQPELFLHCEETLTSLTLPLVTTWPCLTEAMHLTRRRGGWPMQELLGDMIRANLLRLHSPGEDEPTRILTLMAQYQDRPMDLADASLIVLAEVAGYRRIFSIDSDFYVYRLFDGTVMEVVPGPASRRF
jgi:predicted nucleic acid-binding protein